MNFEELRALGLNLIPCWPKTKKPKFDWNEYKQKKYTGPLGNDNAAVICGVTSGNLVVIDIDRAELATKFFENIEGVKMTTLVVQTGRPGLHVYCRPKGNLPPIIKLVDNNNQPVGEIRGQGGYVIAPGSIHENGNKYEIISSVTSISDLDIDALIEKLRSVGIRPLGQLPPVTELVKSVPVGQRNNAAFKYAAHLIGTVGLTDYETVLFEIKRWAKELGFNPTKPNELETVVKSAFKRVKPAVEVVKPEETLKIRDIDAGFEGKEVTFDALIALTEDIQTVTSEINAICDSCDEFFTIKGNGFDNPILPTCHNCKIKMKWDNRTKKTKNVMRVLIEEFLEESKHNSPVRYEGIVNGGNVFKTFSGQRKHITAKYVSVSPRDPRDKNDIILQVKDIEDVDPPSDVMLPQEEINKLKSCRESDKDYDLKIINSFAPHIECDPSIKLMLLLAAIGGSKGVTRRTWANVFIVGNPSKGKTELLKFAPKIVTKGTFVSGVSSTKAGLGSGMVKINGRLVPRAGALVVYSGGLLALDEVDKMKDEDRDALLESEEQGTVTILKSGVEEHLTAETTVISAANPKWGTWDSDQGIIENINLPSFLVSRNDMMWRMIEHSEQDRLKIAKKILQIGNSTNEHFFNEEQLRQFINYIKTQHPIISEAAKIKILQFYEKMSKPTGNEKTLPMQERQLEGLMRFTTALARFRLKDEAGEDEVERVIELYRESLASFGIDTKGDIQQPVLEEFQFTKEQKMEHVIEKAKDDQGEFSMEQVVKGWVEANLFRDITTAVKIFEKSIGTKFLITNRGKFRLSKV